MDLVAEFAGTDMVQVQSSHVMHLARGKVGPFRVDGEACRGGEGSGRVGVQLTLFDEGEGGRAVAGASAVFRLSTDTPAVREGAGRRRRSRWHTASRHALEKTFRPAEKGGP